MTSIIKNKKELAVNSLRRDALDILEAGYKAVATEKIISENICLEGQILKIKDKKYDLKKYKRIFLIALGKCANRSARELENILGDKITAGVALDVSLAKFKKLKSEIGTHPLPSEKNILATKSIVKILKDARKDDLIIIVVSGGGSSLLCAPVDGLENESLKQIIQSLMKKGATIREINIVRKHLSQIKGGQMVGLTHPAQLVSLIFSDVPGDDISSVASGPTVMDKSTKEDARIILESYLSDDSANEDNFVSFLIETPKEPDPFKKTDNILLANNKLALKAMEKKAKELGYVACVESTELQGEARDLGANLIGQKYAPKSCHIWGGETTVQIKGGGEGGRNQEFVLSALTNLPDDNDIVIMAIASDGRDNSDAAGALADKSLADKMERENIDASEYLVNNDSYNFFKKAGTQIKTGETGINVADFYLILKK